MKYSQDKYEDFYFCDLKKMDIIKCLRLYNMMANDKFTWLQHGMMNSK